MTLGAQLEETARQATEVRPYERAQTVVDNAVGGLVDELRAEGYSEPCIWQVVDAALREALVGSEGQRFE